MCDEHDTSRTTCPFTRAAASGGGVKNVTRSERVGSPTDAKQPALGCDGMVARRRRRRKNDDDVEKLLAQQQFTSLHRTVESSQCSVTVVAAVPRRVGGSGPTDRQKAGRSRLRSVFRSGRVFWLPLAGLAALVIGRCGKNSIAEHFLPPARLRWFDGGWKNNHSAVSFGDLDGWLSRKLSCFSFYPRVRRSTLA